MSCPYKDAIDIHDNYIVVGSFEFQDHIKVFDIRKPSGAVQKKTLKSQTALEGHFKPNDTLCKIHSLSFCEFDKRLICVSTCHNNTIKLLEFNSGELNEIFSYEALPTMVMSLDTIQEKKNTIYLSGVGLYGEMNLSF